MVSRGPRMDHYGCLYRRHTLQYTVDMDETSAPKSWSLTGSVRYGTGRMNKIRVPPFSPPLLSSPHASFLSHWRKDKFNKLDADEIYTERYRHAHQPL